MNKVNNMETQCNSKQKIRISNSKQKCKTSGSSHSSKTNNQKKVVVMSKSDFPAFMDRCLWRTHTGFPIAKIYSPKIFSQNSQEKEVSIQIEYELCSRTLADMNLISISIILYLLKECVIGFQRIISYYGYFRVEQKMIYITQKGKCKVWLNVQPWNQEYIKLQQENRAQQQFIRMLITLFQNKAFRGKQENSFFKQIQNIQTFYELLICIKEFANKCNIYIPNNIYSNKQSKKIKKKLNKSLDRRPNIKINQVNTLMPKVSNCNSTNESFMKSTHDTIDYSTKINEIEREYDSENINEQYSPKTPKSNIIFSHNNKMDQKSKFKIQVHQPLLSKYDDIDIENRLRDTIMTKNGWQNNTIQGLFNGLQLCSSQILSKDSFMETDVELNKLGKIGKKIRDSIDIDYNKK